MTLQPVRRHDVDAAVMFADIMTPVLGMGVDVRLVEGVGPVVDEPVRTLADVERLRVPDPEEAFAPVLEAVRLVRAELGSDQAVVGFCGGPFTVAGYLVEGRPSREFEHTKRLMLGARQVWAGAAREARGAPSPLTSPPRRAPGADVIQLFDSWVGALTPAHYREHVAPHSARILAAVDVPTIHFGTGTATLLEEMAAAGGEVIGLDWRIPLDVGWAQRSRPRRPGQPRPRGAPRAVAGGRGRGSRRARPRRGPPRPHLQSRSRRPALDRSHDADPARRARPRADGGRARYERAHPSPGGGRVRGWRRASSERYSADRVENGGFTPANARVKAERDFDLTLPDGLATAGQHVFAIEVLDGQVVGHVWLGERDTGDEGRVAFVYEIRVDEEERSRGYGRTAMLLLEDEARSLGLGRIELNVFGGNEVARVLYRSLGYEERAVMMGKKLA